MFEDNTFLNQENISQEANKDEKTVLTVSQEEIVSFLYQGLVEFISEARDKMIKEEFEESREKITKSQNIVEELYNTLDMNYEISSQMAVLYEFIYLRLNVASVENKVDALEEVLDLAIEFRDTWLEAVELIKKQFAVVS